MVGMVVMAARHHRAPHYVKRSSLLDQSSTFSVPEKSRTVAFGRAVVWVPFWALCNLGATLGATCETEKPSFFISCGLAMFLLESPSHQI